MPRSKSARVAVGRARLVHARRPAREDQGQRVELADPLGRDVVPDDPREGVPLAHPAGDELDVLGAEIEDQNGPRRGIGIHGYSAFATGAEAIRARRTFVRAIHDWLAAPPEAIANSPPRTPPS